MGVGIFFVLISGYSEISKSSSSSSSLVSSFYSTGDVVCVELLFEKVLTFFNFFSFHLFRRRQWKF